MQNAAEVIVRNAGLLAAGESLWLLNLQEPALLGALGLNAYALTWDYRVFHAGKSSAPAKLEFAVAPSDDAPTPSQVVIFLPKSRQELDFLLAQACSRLIKGGEIFVVGEKKEGIAGAERQLKALGDTVKIDSARHCQLWRLTVSTAPKPFVLSDWMTFWPLAVAGQALEIASLPGVFSPGRLDDGTRRLLESGHFPSSGRAMDFGCGSGVIGAFLKRLHPALSVEFSDVNALALACVGETLRRNGLEGAIVPVRGAEDLRGPYQLLASNPPFHAGVKTEYEVTGSLIAKLPSVLAVGGEVRLVANSFLDYPEQITKALRQCETMYDDKHFRVYKAVRMK